MKAKTSQIRRGLPNTDSIEDQNIKRIIDGLILEIRRLQQEVTKNLRK
jgi:hypothetical protein